MKGMGLRQYKLIRLFTLQEVNNLDFYESIGSHLVKYLLASKNEPVFLTLWEDFRNFLYGE